MVDATNLRMNLRLVLELKRLGRPMMVALNMADVARAWRLSPIDAARLSEALGAGRRGGRCAATAVDLRANCCRHAPSPAAPLPESAASRPRPCQAEVRHVAPTCRADRGPHPPLPPPAHRRHRDASGVGLVILATLLFLVFQAVFSWAAVPMDAIRGGHGRVGTWVSANMADGPLRSLIVDGVIAGVGSVLVFLPQILILFFILLLEGLATCARPSCWTG